MMKRDEETIARFPIKTTKVPSRPGCWDVLRVEIFEKATSDAEPVKIGEYGRNYHALYSTFLPFKRKEKYYALYSPDYTATRVMSLPDCKDIGGEEPCGFGFCPTGYAVAFGEYCHQPTNESDPKPVVANHQPDKWSVKVGSRWWWPDDKESPSYDPAREAEYLAEKQRTHDLRDQWMERHPYVNEPFDSMFGFVCGCIWGDDCSWKIQHLDLSRVEEGIITRDARYGYIELLGDAASLASVVEIDNWEPADQRISIACRRDFDMAKRVK